MFLHLGEDVSVSTEDLIFILDLTSISAGIASREFIELTGDEKLITTIGSKKAKSFVLTTERAYFSPISSTTLARRSDQPKQLINNR